MLGSSIASEPQFYRVTRLKTPLGLVIGLFTILARNYNRSQLSTTRLRVYTIIIVTRSYLRSLIPLLHVYTVYKPYSLIFTALLHIKSPNLLTTSSLAHFSVIGHFHRLSHTVAHAKSSTHCEPTHFLELIASQSLQELLPNNCPRRAASEN
jgi:hypothetical protein